jgi:hypothetical protein
LLQSTRNFPGRRDLSFGRSESLGRHLTRVQAAGGSAQLRRPFRPNETGGPRQCAPPVVKVWFALKDWLVRNKGLTYYGSVNITLSLDDDLVKEVRKIAVERDTTLTGLVRAYLQELAAEHAKSGRKRRELEALERSFEEIQLNIGKRTWRREDLHERR